MKRIRDIKQLILFTSVLSFSFLSFFKTAAADSALTLINPLEADDIVEFLLAVLDILLTFAIPIIILFIIYAGFLFVTAQGDTSKITTARTALTWSVVGGVIILGAKLILAVIENTVSLL